MIWAEHLYLSESIRNPEKIKRKIRQHAGLPFIYVIVLSDREDEQLVIYCADEYLKDYMKKRNDYAIGICRGKLRARNMIGKIFSDVYEKTGSCDVKSYFLSQKEKEERR